MIRFRGFVVLWFFRIFAQSIYYSTFCILYVQFSYYTWELTFFFWIYFWRFSTQNLKKNRIQPWYFSGNQPEEKVFCQLANVHIFRYWLSMVCFFSFKWVLRQFFLCRMNFHRLIYAFIHSMFISEVLIIQKQLGSFYYFSLETFEWNSFFTWKYGYDVFNYSDSESLTIDNEFTKIINKNIWGMFLWRNSSLFWRIKQMIRILFNSCNERH